MIPLMQRRAPRLARGVAAVLGVLLLALFTAHVAAAAASAWVGDARSAVRLVTAEQAAGSSQTIDAALEIRLAPGWHAYWRTPGAAGLPPSIDWKGSQNLAGATIEWPAPHRFVLDGLETYGYADRVVLPITARVAKPGAPLALHAAVSYAVCRNICIPRSADLTLSLPPGTAVPGPEAGLIAAAQARVPGSLGALGFSLVSARAAPAARGRSTLEVALATHGRALHRPDLFVEGLPNGAPAAPSVTLEKGGAEAVLTLRDIDSPASALEGRELRFTLTNGAGAASFTARPSLGALPEGGAWAPLAILAVALVGGLILNVMPCVLPVLGLKVMGLTRLAGAKREEVRIDLLATALGVVIGFGGLALALIGLKWAGAAVGWGIQFQEPWFLAAMTMVMALFAADLWGWITIELPAGLGGFLATRNVRSRHGNALLTGVFATLLATSCSAPFVGTAVGFALARGTGEILAIFLAMGIGMALPYLAAAAVPALASLMPKPGRWMTVLRVILGLLLMATGVWLLTVLGSLGRPLEALLVGLLALALLGVLALRGKRLVRSPRQRLASGVAGVLIAAAIGIPLAGAALLHAPTPAAHASAGVWRPFAESAIAANVAAGRTVLVNVTADWCLICKVNELTVFDRAPVAKRLAEPSVVAMQADWTRANPAITNYLQGFGRYGVPLDVVYGPGAPDGIVLPDLVTSAEVLHAFARASGGTLLQD